MGIESATYISDLNEAWPLGSDLKSTLDNHHRLTKAAIKTTFPNVTGAVTPTHTELNYVDGVTSAIQTQIDGKLALTGGTISSNLAVTGTLGVTGAFSGTTGAFSGAVTGVTATAGDSSTKFATTAYVQSTAFSSALPSQTGNSGKFVTTDGTNASWSLFSLTSGVSGTLAVGNGGIGVATLTAYAPIFAGTTSTGPVQSGTVGSSGQVLMSNGAGALPTFQTLATTAPALVCLVIASASNVATVDFTSLIDNTYDEYEFHLVNVISASGQPFSMRYSANSGSSFFATAYTGASRYSGSAGTGGDGSFANASAIGLTTQTVSSTVTAGGLNGVVKLFGPSGTASNKTVSWSVGYANPSAYYVEIGAGNYTASQTAIDAVRFFFNSGDITSGLFKLYGVRKSV